MFKTLSAKFPGTCKRCQQPFEAGSKIRYGGRGRTYHLKADCPASTLTDPLSESDDTTLTPAEMLEVGRGVDTFVIGGKAFTRNRAGRCEDAPCCGCCTI